jgi:putative hydrolase of the HAD superfamily
MRQLKLALFDIGGVIVDVSNTAYFNYLSAISGIPPAEVERRLTIDAAPLERGHISLKSFTKVFAEDLGIDENDVKWGEYFKKIAKLDEGTVEIIKELSKNYHIAYLSNVDKVRYDYVTNHVMKGILHYFDYEFASFKMRCIKPSPLIYKKVIAKMKLRPEDIIFIDNDYHNVQAAKGLGITSILFTRAALLRKELKQFGMKI